MANQLRTSRKRRSGKAELVAIVVCLCIVAVALFFGYEAYHRHAIEQGAASIRQTVLDSALQCAAIEGSYPSELSHLEENYGLTINHGDYVVIYDCFASNVPPSVTVMSR